MLLLMLMLMLLLLLSSVPAGAAEPKFTIGRWTLSEDPTTGDLVFKFDGSKKQAVLRNPLKPNSCPGSKLAKWCVE
jgi:hypothetical protein